MNKVTPIGKKKNIDKNTFTVPSSRKEINCPHCGAGIDVNFEGKMQGIMLNDENNRYYERIVELSDALKEIYANNGEDFQIAEIIEQLKLE